MPASISPSLRVTDTQNNTPDSENSKGHILIVEDWQPNVLVVTLMLEMCGYTFDIATEGCEALKLFESRSYDAVLMDVGLPDTTGYRISQEMRAHERGQGLGLTPIIATTAYAMKGDREKCLMHGMTDYLAKPLNSTVLDTLLQKYITAFSPIHS